MKAASVKSATGKKDRLTDEKRRLPLYYSSKYQLNSQGKLQAFTAVGKISMTPPTKVEMFEGFFPFRRDVSYYQPIRDCSIEQVRLHPEWHQYASQLRYGHFEISKDFFLYVFEQMKLDNPVET